MQKHAPFGLRAVLLASASMVVMTLPARAADITNTVPVTSASGPVYSLGAGQALVNTSAITVTGGTVAAVQVAPVVAGTITNSGTIQSQSSSAAAIGLVSGSTLSAIINSGSVANWLVPPDQAGGTAIDVTGGAVLNSLSNAAGGVIFAFGTNSVGVHAGGIIGSLVNAGSINGIDVANGGSIGVLSNNVGGVVNEPVSAAIIIEQGGRIGAINNAGTISGGRRAASGISIGGYVNSISNTGLIWTNLSNSENIANQGTVGTILNAGTILARDSGIGIYNTGSIGAIINSGSVVLARGKAIVNTSGTIGSIVNSAGGLLQGGSPTTFPGTAIDNGSAAGPVIISNAGTIFGTIRLSAYGDTLNVLGGVITGPIVDTANSGTVNFDLGKGGSFTTAGSISGVDAVNVRSGQLYLHDPVSGAAAFMVASGASVLVGDGVGATRFTNAGLVDVGRLGQTVAGSYTQTSTGTLRFTLDSTANGGLNVTGNASLTGGPKALFAQVPPSVPAGALIGQTRTVISAGTLLVTNLVGVASDAIGLGFDVGSGSTNLTVTIRSGTYAEAFNAASYALSGAFSPLLSYQTTNDLAVQDFIKSALAGLAVSGNLQQTQNLRATLTTASPQQLLQFERQLAPTTLSSASLSLDTAMSLFGLGLAGINNRLTVARAKDTGLAAGDTAGRGIAAWVQPFGSFLTQQSKEGLDGYSAGIYGVTLGGDMLATPDLRVGMALTLANTDLRYDGTLSGAKGSIFNVQLGLYGVWHHGDLFVDGLLSFGYNKYSSHMPLLGALRDTDYDGTQFAGQIGVGYDLKLPGQLLLSPYASGRQLHASFAGYNTTGVAPFDMHVAGQSADVTTTSLGLRLARQVTLPIGVLTPEIHANWLHNFGTDRLTTTYTTADVVTPGVFNFAGPQTERDLFNLGVGAKLAQHGPLRLVAGYDFAGRASAAQHLFHLQARWSF